MNLDTSKRDSKTDYFKIFRPESLSQFFFSTKSFENAIKFDVKR